MKKANAKKKTTTKPQADASMPQAQQSTPADASNGAGPVCCDKPMQQMPPDGRRSTNDGRRFRCATCQRTTKRKLTEVARG